MRKLRQININNILFLDIETVPVALTMSEAPMNIQNEWVYKHKFKDDAPPITDDIFDETSYRRYFENLWTKKAGFSAEFSRIVCISFGFLNGETFRMKSCNQQSEKELLESFCTVLNQFIERNTQLMLCAHFGKGFDFPFITKRLLAHRMEIPSILDVYGLKPWEMTQLLDTLEIWRFGGGEGAGLPAIAMHFGIPTPKDDISGADVARVYYSEGMEGVKRITVYCEKDVVTLINVFKAMRGEELLKEGQVQIVT